MTIPETILNAVHVLVDEQGLEIFTREEIRNQAGVEREEWNKSYSPTFQGMRAAPAGKGPSVGERFKNIFEQVEHGKYQLTDYGKNLIKEINED